MRYGDEIKLFRSGLRLTPKQAAALGTLDEGQCWAVWVDTESGRPSSFGALDDDEFDPSNQGPHLVVSPIHPDKWPAVFSVTVRMNRRAGTMRTLLATLSECGVNVLFANSAIAGYNLSIARLICEIPKWTDEVERELAGLDSLMDEKARPENVAVRRVALMQRVGRTVVSIAATLEAKLVMRDRELRKSEELGDVGASIPFLHRRSAEVGMNPWFCSALDFEIGSSSKHVARTGLLGAGVDSEDSLPRLQQLLSAYWKTLAEDLPQVERFGPSFVAETQRRVRARLGSPDEGPSHFLREVWRDSGVKAVSVRGLVSLSYARVWAGSVDRGRYDPVCLRYNASTRTLRVDQAVDSMLGPDFTLQRQLADRAGCSLQELAEPATALCHYNHEEKSMRLRFLRGEFARRYAVQIDVEYMWNHRHPLPSLDSPKGTLERVCATLQELDMTVDRVENCLTGSAKGKERGRIRLMASSLVKRNDPDGFFSDDARRAMGKLIEDGIRSASLAGTIDPIIDLRISVVPLSDGVDGRPSS